jgi:hypothetical protein
VTFTVYPDVDAEQCLLLWRVSQIEAMETVGEITDPQVLEPEQRSGGTGSEGDPPTAISMSYVYRHPASEGQPVKVMWGECRAVPGGALAISHSASQERYPTEIAARQALLTGLSIPAADPPQPSTQPVPASLPSAQAPFASAAAPAASAGPDPDGSAAPVVADPACTGVPEWASATIARFDRIEAARMEAREVGAYDLIGFIASFAGQVAGMAARQEAGPVPDLAAEVNALAVAAYGVIEEAADLQYEGLTGGGGAALARGQRLFEDGMMQVNDARKEVERLRGRCTPEG